MENNFIIEAHNIKKSFGSIIALDGISFKVKKGEIFGFLGPNGAGKTTTFRILTGIIKPDEGNAKIAGYDILKETIKAKELIGVLPETPNAYPDLSVWKNITFIAHLYNVKNFEEKARNLLKEFDLYDRKDSKAKELSKGMKQRLLLCMAMINDPPILFLDEPTNGVDVQSARLIRTKIMDLGKEGKTIFLTTHNLEEANLMCDRVAIIKKGKIICIDSPENLRKITGKTITVEVKFDREFDDAKKVFKGAEIDGKTIKISTESVNDTIYYITDLARDKRLKIESINVEKASLEDVFIKLVEGKC
ncbi:MAG: ABC transporter ATP-binding protein [Thermoplasmatales archaeon]|nr:ABC transporter ATP-binding protein [Thermoplasmatales archaeon]